jgi:hypothetical protein
VGGGAWDEMIFWRKGGIGIGSVVVVVLVSSESGGRGDIVLPGLGLVEEPGDRGG